VEYPFNDPELSWQWHYNNDGSLSEDSKAGADINLLNAWKYTAGDNRVIVAVVDGGIMADHPDLKDNMWVNEAEKNGQPGVDDDGNGYIDDIHGYNFIDNPVNVEGQPNPVWTDTFDNAAHGTHVAGTIAAVSNNGKGIAGVAGGDNGVGGVRIMACQILGGKYNTSDEDAAARAMEYAADMGAVIASNSWGNDPGAITTDNTYKVAMSARYVAFNYFMKKKNHPALDGGIIVFAAGNESTAMAGYPGAYS
jgi:subtilisin family serine protease